MPRRVVTVVASVSVIAFVLAAGQFAYRGGFTAAPAAVPEAAHAPPPKGAMDPARPRPDARVSLALRSLWSLSGHSDSLRIDWRFAENAWHLRLNDRDAGTAGPYPAYAELRTLLLDASRALMPDPIASSVAPASGAVTRVASAGSPTVAADLTAGERCLDGLRALDALEIADRAWVAGRRDAAVIGLAERALLELDLVANDQVGAGDEILGRALALSTLRLRLDPGASPEDECLLASRLGYEAEACARADKLPADLPVRAFVLHEDERLSRLAAQSTSPFTAYLRLVRYADAHDLAGWNAWRKQHLGQAGLPDAPLLASELALGEFGDAAAAGAELSSGLCRDLGLERRPEVLRAIQQHKAPLGAVLDAFETTLAAAPARPDHALLDSTVVQAYCRSVFYSGLFSVGVFLCDRYSSVAETGEFAESLGEPSSPAAAEFAGWYRHLANVKQGKGDTQALKRDVLTLRHFGEPLLARTWVALAQGASPTSITTRVAAHAMDGRLDTRPAALWTLASVHAWPNFDLAWAEDLMAASVRGLHPADAPRRAAWAAYVGDSLALEALLVDSRVRPTDRDRVLQSLAQLAGEDAPRIEAAYRDRLAHEPGNFDVANAYAEHCFKLGRGAEAGNVMRQWLARADRTRGAFDDINAQIQVSRACQDLGDLPGALVAASEAAASGKYSALARKARVLEAMGRTQEAAALAIEALQRYPDSGPALAGVVSQLWSAGSYEKAAQVLARTPYPPSGYGWRWDLAPEFARRFARQPEAGVRAAEALAEQGIDVGRHLHDFALAVKDSGNVELAYELYRRMPAKGQEQLRANIFAVDMLRRSRGDGAAREVLAHLAAPGDPLRLSMQAAFAFSNGADEVLWMLPVPKQKTEDTQYFWLMRAASVVARPAQPATRRAEVERYLSSAPAGRYVTIGRFLLGRADETALAAETRNDRDWGEIYYYEGLSQQSQGNYREAARSYAKGIATGQRTNGEYPWCVTQLMVWAGRSMSLDRIALADRASAN